MRDVDAAYLAGIIDGEGCLTPIRGYPRIRIVMSDYPTVSWVAATMGTRLHKRGPYGVGLKQLWDTTAHGTTALSVLREVRPYLITKADAADDALLWRPKRIGGRPWSHCKHGHEFTPSNTRRKKNGTKTCITCQKARDKVRVRVWVPRRQHANH